MHTFNGTSVNVGRLWVALALVLIMSSVSFAATPSAVSQFGSTKWDQGFRVATDSNGNIYVAGDSKGNFDGLPQNGTQDGFLRKMDSTGKKIWSILIGTAAYEEIRGLAVDKDGNVFVVGSTKGSFVPSFGGSDAFIAKVSPDGEILWLDQSGTSYDDAAMDVALDENGNAYVCGWTIGNMGNKVSPQVGYRDALVMKYSPDGKRVWTTQFNNYYGNNTLNGIAIYDGKIYVTGIDGLPGWCSDTLGNLLLYAFDLNGYHLWHKSMGSEGSTGYAIAVNADGIYIAGWGKGPFDKNTTYYGGYQNAIFLKFDLAGNKQWFKSWGVGYGDKNYGVALDIEGNVYVSGTTYPYNGKTLGGQVSPGSSDGYICKFTADGDYLYTNLIGTKGVDYGMGICLDPNGNILLAGLTAYVFPGQTTYRDGADAYVTVYPCDNPSAYIKKTNTPPVVSLRNDSGYYAQGLTVSLAGTGWDAEDQALPTLVWTSSIDGQLGVGENLYLSNLSVGTHTIILTAIDSNDATTSQSMTVTIYALGDTTATITVLKQGEKTPIGGALVTMVDKKGNTQSARTNYQGIVIFNMYWAGKADIYTEKAGLFPVANPDTMVINKGAKNSVVVYK